MNKQSISHILKVSSIIIITLISLSVIYCYKTLYIKNTYYPTANKGRILTNSAELKIEKAVDANNFNTSVNSDYKYAAVDLNGKVLMSSIDQYKENTIVNLHDFLQYDNKFSTSNPNIIKYTEPLIIKNAQAGTVVFYIPKKEFLISSPAYFTTLQLMPVTFFLAAVCILSIYLYFYLKKNILTPLSNLNESAIKILNGDFSCKIKYDYDNEVGIFCHDFEAMRDELKFSKEKEEAIKVSEKELLACISHDMKTPLTAIGGYVSGIKDGIVKDREGIENYCTIILKRVKMLSKLLEDILENSKGELNKMNIALSEFYCRDFFEGILEDISIEIESKGIQYKAPDEIPDLLINADKKRITQVMYNLVSNSIKYSNKNDTISIYFETDKNYLKVFIKDTGIGISSADIPYIFNKFYRGEKSRSQSIPGSGLGLSISKYIVEAHGGFISCIESSSKGTTMCFGIPI